MHAITADTLISEALATHPRAAEVFDRFGLGCPGCYAASMETVSAVASVHDVSVDLLLRELNADSEQLFEEPA